MEVHIPPELQAKLVDCAADQGRAVDELVEEALARYLADGAQFFQSLEDWTDEERLAAMSHIEEGFSQAERGELIDGSQARREIQELKDVRRLQRQSAR